MGAFAEFKRALIRERQREGIALAKQRGAYKGRKKTLTPERAAELAQRAATGVPKSVNLSRSKAKVANCNPCGNKSGAAHPNGTPDRTTPHPDVKTA
jgi:DNA invertase Pin-like site-specific DNA recombinase